jgi:predicted RNA-binding Zn-ribbon protein involved in translation (DUF1610 family)
MNGMQTHLSTHLPRPEATQLLCPDCGAVMLLARVMPKVLDLPEQHSYKCPKCGTVMTWEVDTSTAPH